MLFIIMFFFFSSRRRHTRYWRDWSSDVCSSDLTEPGRWRYFYPVPVMPDGRELWHADEEITMPRACVETLGDHLNFATLRSEERRVGKECRSRWSPYH